MPIPSYILPSAPVYTEDSVYALIPTPSTPIYTPDAISFTRGSDATRTASNGFIQRSPVNLASYSEDFSNAAWQLDGVTITSNQIASPTGTLTADLMTSLGTGQQRIYQTYTVSSGISHTISIYLKQGTAPSIQVVMPYVGGGPTFTFATATFSTVSGWTSSVETLPNGWYRISATISTTSAQAGFQLILPSNGSTVYLWGAQFTQGSQPLTYFPTTDRLNVPRIDFSQGSCPALLLEPQRTNLVLNSNDMTLWSNGAGTMTKNVTTSPDGTNNALSFDNTGQCSTFVNAVNGTYSYSLFVKNGTSLAASIDMSDGATGDVLTTFTFSTKTFSGTSAGGSWTSASTSFVELNNGWFRITLTATKNAGSQIGYKINSTGVGGTSTYVYGAQLELGSYATTYIPTTTTSVTRLADACFKTGISSLIGQTEGTLFLDFIFKTSDSNVSGQIGVSDSAKLNRVILWNNFTFNTLALQLKANNVNAINNVSLGTFVDGTRYKIAIAYKSGDTVVYVNGTQTITNSSTFTFASSLTDFILGSYETTLIVGNQFCFRSALFTSRLTNTQLASLTTL